MDLISVLSTIFRRKLCFLRLSEVESELQLMFSERYHEIFFTCNHLHIKGTELTAHRAQLCNNCLYTIGLL